MTETNDARIAREEAEWTGPKLFGFGLAFLAVCVVIIYVMASV